ncbi:NAD(P)-dependent oxidoreductase [Haloferax sp. Atlit-4N]|uniref:SDR family NAD(P)-dependent oxidoreductase n=1 Tax=Haloferax sp. Atlit-4N TaxID=2077206 RepID=UPI000E220CB7|nr:SDR family oxidoreductase [Haloferax sp. Atlit-4N]RDZ51365.1 NAD(P)-dependent oxidoreductase [Haloferax sp. Atlit-4N]
MDDNRLAGKHCVVTGGANGIGRGVAVRIAIAGANVTVFDLEPSNETVEAIEDTGSEAGGYEVDVTSRSALAEAVEDAIDKRGPISGLVNSAGVQTKRPFLETPTDELTRHLDINVGGTFISSQIIASHMTDNGEGGAIVNIGSLAGAGSPNRGQAAYAASKGAIGSLTTVMAMELADHDIRCNVIHPGAIDTPMLAAFADESENEDSERTINGERLADRHLVGRIGEPEDVGHLCVLLLSREGEWITGQDFVVDGGVAHSN